MTIHTGGGQSTQDIVIYLSSVLTVLQLYTFTGADRFWKNIYFLWKIIVTACVKVSIFRSYNNTYSYVITRVHIFHCRSNFPDTIVLEQVMNTLNTHLKKWFYGETLLVKNVITNTSFTQDNMLSRTPTAI